MAKRPSGAMHVAKVTSRRGEVQYTSYLLRQSYRVSPNVKKRTLANLSMLPLPIIETIRRGLAGELLLPASEALSIEYSRPHGHVAAVLGTARKLGLAALVDPQPSRQRHLVVGMISARVLHPASKLATTRLLDTTSLGPLLGVEEAPSADELYAAMGLGSIPCWSFFRAGFAAENRAYGRWISPARSAVLQVTNTLWNRVGHGLAAGAPGAHRGAGLAKRGHSRDGRPGKEQVEFGLLTNPEGVLQATEQQLAKVAAMVERGARRRRGLRGAAAIGERVGRVVNRYDMAKHFIRTVTDSSFSYVRNAVSIEREAARDGRYVLRTNVAKERLGTEEVVLAYQSLAQVEQAFRSFKRCCENTRSP